MLGDLVYLYCYACIHTVLYLRRHLILQQLNQFSYTAIDDNNDLEELSFA